MYVGSPIRTLVGTHGGSSDLWLVAVILLLDGESVESFLMLGFIRHTGEVYVLLDWLGHDVIILGPVGIISTRRE